MKPSVERTLASQFETLAIARGEFTVASLWICRSASDQAIPIELVQRYESALKKSSRNGYFNLDESDFETAFEMLVANEADLPQTQALILLSRNMKIHEWRIAGNAVPTQSTLTWVYGPNPYLSTFFRFNTRDEFDYIRSIFADLKICKLNEKHLKRVR
ncbi:MAG TPA: hypothetical protein VFB27_00295 [Opitutaceae bacterium]|nr:hypothetical protein [Opitutaceae bacterium]